MDNRDYEEALDKCWNKFCESKPTLSKQAGVLTLFNFIFNYLYPINKHNLTSDAEGEEMLTVTRSKVQEVYKTSKEIVNNEQYGTCLYSMHTQIMCVLENLFGSKCLPDEKSTTQFKIGDKVRAKGTKQIGTIKEPYSNDIGYRVYFEDGDGGWDKEYQEDELIPYKEPKPTEPKFKVGDKVECLHNHHIYVIRHLDFYDGIWRYNYGNPAIWIKESDLEPYTEPKKGGKEGKTGEKLENSQSDQIANCDNQFDTILKDSFSKERRLNIATRIMSAILSNQMMLNNLAHGETTAEGVVRCVVDTTMMYTNALLSKCEKGGKS